MDLCHFDLIAGGVPEILRVNPHAAASKPCASLFGRETAPENAPTSYGYIDSKNKKTAIPSLHSPNRRV